jgi:hypothetical protein
MIRPPRYPYKKLEYRTTHKPIIKLVKKYIPKRRDLLEAQAAVNWAMSKLPSFDKRLNTWIKRNFDMGIEETDPHIADDVLIAITKGYIPLEFNAEYGAYLNSIRTSLDLLATALACRHNIPKPDSHYFPVAKDLAHFQSNGLKGREFINELPVTERKMIEDLKPYKGGNDLLWLLHQLDIKRKHKRLIDFVVSPASFQIDGWGVKLVPFSTGDVIHTDNKTMICLISKDSAKPNILFIPQITICEKGLSLIDQPAIDLLGAFANLATSIIKSFDTS